MIWFAVVFYVVLSPLACLLIGRAIRVREAERPVELLEPAAEAPQVPVAACAALLPPAVPVAS